MAKATNENVQAQIDDHLYQDDDDGDELDPMDELAQECGLGDDGQCAMAGTDHCDFTCPWRNSEDFAGSAAWRAKHGHRRKDWTALSRLRKAIIDNTKGDLFWIGEILLAELEKETGFKELG